MDKNDMVEVEKEYDAQGVLVNVKANGVDIPFIKTGKKEISYQDLQYPEWAKMTQYFSPEEFELFQKEINYKE